MLWSESGSPYSQDSGETRSTRSISQYWKSGSRPVCHKVLGPRAPWEYWGPESGTTRAGPEVTHWNESTLTREKIQRPSRRRSPAPEAFTTAQNSRNLKVLHTFQPKKFLTHPVTLEEAMRSHIQSPASPSSRQRDPSCF